MRVAPWLLAGLLALTWAAPSAGDPREIYRKGIGATDRKEWSTAERLMRQAIAERPVESGEPVKIYGSRFLPYLPHFYLGLARFGLGDCEGALLAWQESERQGTVRATAQFRSLLANRETCRQRIATPAPVPAKPPAPEPTVVETERRPATAPETQPGEPAGDPAAEPRAAPPDPAEVGRLEERAGDLAPAPVSPTGEPGAGPPAELRAAARALFQGDPRTVIQTLAPKRFGDQRAQAASHLLQAAARYAVYAESGDQALRDQARESVRACRRLDPRLRPASRWFSPNFVRFFDAPD